MHAIHLKCAREGYGYANMTKSDEAKHAYRVGGWEMALEDAEALVGGWLYLHATKKRLSDFGGKVLRVEADALDGEDAGEGVAFVFEADMAAKGQEWREAQKGVTWTGGVVDAELDHEISSAEETA